MPTGRGTQSNTMLYTVITFAALFIISSISAIVFYVKSEDYRTAALAAQKQTQELANSREQGNLAQIVGTNASGKSWIGTMTGYVDEVTTLVLGGVPEDTSAEVKVQRVRNALNDIKSQVATELGEQNMPLGQNAGLARVAVVLKNELLNTRTAMQSTLDKLDELVLEFTTIREAAVDKDAQFNEQIGNLAEEARVVQQGFNQLETLMTQSTDAQINSLREKHEQTMDDLASQKSELLKTKAQLEVANQIRERYQKQIEEIQPKPDTDVAAFKEDGKILSVDNQAKVVFLNLGTKDHVYRGLTFSVFDRNVPIPKDGKGKAEIEVFDIEENVSVARIINSNKKNPVIADDIVANLIWDSSHVNEFTIAGDFDIDKNGVSGTEDKQKIIDLIEKWGGVISDTVTINTDFVVLGEQPVLLSQPSHEDIEIDPMAMEKYLEAIEKRSAYLDIQKKAIDISAPIFNMDRFLYFIGYKTISTKNVGF